MTDSERIEKAARYDEICKGFVCPACNAPIVIHHSDRKELQDQPDENVEYGSNASSVVHPVATLKDEFGGVSHIIVDDHCYVLLNKIDGEFKMAYHWYEEAVEALKGLPDKRINY